MKIRIIRILLSTASLCSMSAVAAQAQTPLADTSTDDDGIVDIVVTAQKRSQNLQDVPVAVSALAGEELESRGVSETSDLQGFVPSLQITTPYGRTQPNFSLRGVSVANEFSSSTASPVGVYVDEVYQSFRASHGQQLYDLERVEVLRGPQGTLYGRNTTGGAISFFSNKPSLSGSEGQLTLGYGNYDTKTAEGVLEFTLVPDKLGIRFAGTVAKGDGWQFNPIQNRDVGTTNTVASRVSLRWQPTSSLDINLKGYFARDNPLAPNPYALGQLANGGDVLGYSRFGPQAALGGRLLGRDEVAADTGGRYYTSSHGAALNIAYDISDDLSVTSITGYDVGRYRNSPFDCDGSPNSVCALRYNSTSTNFNQDLRFNYKNDRLNVIAGLYYGIDRIKTRNEIDFFGVLKPILLGAGVGNSFFNAPVSAPQAAAFVPAFAVDPTLDPTLASSCASVATGNTNGFLDARSLIAFLTDVQIDNSGGGGFGGAVSAACRAAGAPPFGPINGEQRFTVERPSAAIYADVSYDLTDALTISVGLRYTKDKIRYLNGRTVLTDLGGTIRASTIPYSFPYDASLPALEQRERANRLTGRINASYDFAEDILGYVNYSRGYRSGSFNGLAYQGTNQVYYIQPEQINAYEGGFKTRFFDRRVQLNLAGFYYDYKNHQVTQVIGATTFTRSANGILYGGEAELAIQAAPWLRFDASASLLRSEYRGNVVDPTNPSSPTRNVNGNPFPNAPRTTFAAGFDWDILNRNESNLTLRGDVAYTGKYFFDPFGDYNQSPCDRPGAPGNARPAGPAITCGNPGYWLVNSRLTYNRGNYSASLWAKNLTNKFYYTYGLNIDIFGLDYVNRGTPRTYGIELTAKF